MYSILHTGDRVRYRGELFYAKLNGSSLYLYRDKAMSGDADFVPRRSSVKKVIFRKKPRTKKGLASVVEEPEEADRADPQGSESSSDEIQRGYRFLAVVADLDHKEDHLKLVMTNNLAQRIRPFRLLNANHHYVLIADTAPRNDAGLIQLRLEKQFSDSRVFNSQVYTAKPRVVEVALGSDGFKRCDDGIFRRVKD